MPAGPGGTEKVWPPCPWQQCATRRSTPQPRVVRGLRPQESAGAGAGAASRTRFHADAVSPRGMQGRVCN